MINMLEKHKLMLVISFVVCNYIKMELLDRLKGKFASVVSKYHVARGSLGIIIRFLNVELQIAKSKYALSGELLNYLKEEGESSDKVLPSLTLRRDSSTSSNISDLYRPGTNSPMTQFSCTFTASPSTRTGSLQYQGDNSTDISLVLFHIRQHKDQVKQARGRHDKGRYDAIVHAVQTGFSTLAEMNRYYVDISYAASPAINELNFLIREYMCELAFDRSLAGYEGVGESQKDAFYLGSGFNSNDISIMDTVDAKLGRVIKELSIPIYRSMKKIIETISDSFKMVQGLDSYYVKELRRITDSLLLTSETPKNFSKFDAEAVTPLLLYTERTKSSLSEFSITESIPKSPDNPFDKANNNGEYSPSKFRSKSSL